VGSVPFSILDLAIVGEGESVSDGAGRAVMLQ